jgi:hypothetical protein
MTSRIAGSAARHWASGMSPAFRVVYRLVDDDGVAEVVAVGARGGHDVYHAALARLTDPGDNPDDPVDGATGDTVP